MIENRVDAKKLGLAFSSSARCSHPPPHPSGISPLGCPPPFGLVGPGNTPPLPMIRPTETHAPLRFTIATKVPTAAPSQTTQTDADCLSGLE